MSEFKTEQDGDKAIEETVDGTLQREIEVEQGIKITAVGVSPPVKKPRKQKPIKVEEAVPPFELPEVEIVIEEPNVEVQPEAEAVVPEAEVKQAEAAPAPEAPKQVITPAMLRELRARDPDHKRTCAKCGRRVPIAKIGAKGQVCEDCK